MELSYERHFRRWVRNERWLVRLHDYVSPLFSEIGNPYLLPSAGGFLSLPGVTRTIQDRLLQRATVSSVTIVRRAPSAVRQRKERYRPVISLKTQQAEARARSGEQRAKVSKGKTINLSPLLALRGAMRGTLVHRQVEEMIRLSEEEMLAAPGNEYGIHPDTTSIFRALLGIHVRPFKSEFRAYSCELSVATKIDLLGIDHDGRILVIEDKTGYESSFSMPTGSEWICPELRRWPATAETMALVQVVIGLLLVHSVLGVPIDQMRALVIHVTKSRTDIVELTRDEIDIISRAVCAQLVRTRGNVK
jgi:hypothetical protein